jgi:hypothetical protein
MRTVIRFEPGDVRPDREVVLSRMGFGPGDLATRAVDTLVARARELFDARAAPAALFDEISTGAFGEVYEGAGENEALTPLEELYPRAEALALFAATLGRAMDEAIRGLFDCGDPAVGYVLDVTAAAAAEQLAQVTADRFLETVTGTTGRATPLRALAYSPGYCGWHVSGQHALFERLRPERLGVELTSGALMDPIKSVSGVIVAGPYKAHTFRPTYSFCRTCATHACRSRIASLRRPSP